MSQAERRFSIRALIATAVATIIVTVVALELAGRIEHRDDKENSPVGEFTAIRIDPGSDYRMSAKSAELHAVCDQGYLAIAADADPSFRGLLVDYRNRGVRCGPTPGQGAGDHNDPPRQPRD